MSAAAQRLRRSAAIRGYIGANGSGKSLTAIADLLPSLASGRPVLSAVRLLDWNARPGDPCLNAACDVVGHGVPESGHVPSHPGWIPLRRMTQLLEVEHCDILLDEVGSLVSSRQSASLPFQIEALLQQCRKDDLTVSWTAPAWGRADKILREVSTLATVCRGHGTRRHPERLWSQRRLIQAVSYHAADLDDFEVVKVQAGPAATRPRRVAAQWYRVIKSAASRAYDTFEPVPPLGFAAQSGLCVSCGGRRAPVKCSCDDPSMIGIRSRSLPRLVPLGAARGAREPSGSHGRDIPSDMPGVAETGVPNTR